MNKHLILVAFLIISFLGIQSGYSQEIKTSEILTQESSTPKDIVIALDSSGSAKANDPEFFVGQITRGILGGLPKGSRAGLIVFADKSEMAIPLTPVAEEGMDEKINEVLDKIKNVKPARSDKPATITTVTLKKGETLWDLADKYYGDPYKWPTILEWNDFPRSGKGIPEGTVVRIPAQGADKSAKRVSVEKPKNIPAAIENAVYELKQNGRSDAIKQMLVITDGIINIRDSALAVERYRWLKDELATDSRSAGIQIFSIALSEQADYELMQTLARKTGGNYYRVFMTEDIKMALNGFQQTKHKVAPKKEVVSAPTSQVAKIKKEAPAPKQEGNIPWGLLLGGLGTLAVSGIAVFAYIKLKGRGAESMGRTVPGAYLMDLSGVTEKSNYAINKNIIKIGRAGNENVDICIDGETVSGEHAQIEYRDNGFYLTDLGSTNGSYVNGSSEKIAEEVRLKAGDIISFDHYQFKLVVRGPGERGVSQIDRKVPSRLNSRPSSARPQASRVPSGPNIPSVTSGSDMETDMEVSSLEAYLEDSSGITDKSTHKINKKMIKIGRAQRADIDICIAEGTVSSAHACIEYKDGNFCLKDLGSRNGTYINEGKDRITSEVSLKGDDVIYFDQYKFKFIIHSQEASDQGQLASSTSETSGS